MYTTLRNKLIDLADEFAAHAPQRRSLRHEACWLRDHVIGSESWKAFIEYYRYLPESRWFEWHVFPNGNRCGRFFGVGREKPEFARLAEEVLATLLDLRLLDGNGETFNASLPTFSGWEAWLDIIYEVAYGWGEVELSHRYWEARNELSSKQPEESWSPSDASGISFPWHPPCWTLTTDVFTASHTTLMAMLFPRLEPEEYFTDLPNDRLILSYLPEHISTDRLHPIDDVIPVWDHEAATLSFSGKVVREYHQEAPRQIFLLDTFHEHNWEQSVENPFFDVSLGERDPVRCLHDTVCDFNRANKDGPLVLSVKRGKAHWAVRPKRHPHK